jgi:hypothetical protein
MKVLFAGPSLAGLSPDMGDVALRPPASHGDLACAVLEGATAIGLVDGYFDAVAAVWHKEILFALSRGVHVCGAASMGALRAAECAPFGMLPIGEIALSYLDGRRDDDADVGLTHAPAELGYLPLTEPMVDVEATLARLAALDLLQPGEHAALLAQARSLHFSERPVERLFAPAWGERGIVLGTLYRQHHVPQKQRDALELLDHLRRLAVRPTPAGFTFAPSPMWIKRLAALHPAPGTPQA